ncbi:MAG: ABC transporter substrate-binding protein [Gemmatimonadota bacterium]
MLNPIRWSGTALALAALLPLLAGIAGCSEVVNNPNPRGSEKTNTLFVSFGERPKYLDPVSSYSNNETPWMYGAYEPLLRYDYLKRPYTLEANTATGLPEVRYLDKVGKPLPADSPAGEIAISVYTFHLKPGIKFQPHPAFARRADGTYLYQDLTPADIKDKWSVSDFPLKDAAVTTRELTADDYVYQIKRLASPYVPTPSPLYGLLNQYIVDLKGLGDRLRAEYKQVTAGKNPLDRYVPWRDLRTVRFDGARAVDAHTLEIRVIGKYPQFKFWVAMPFFAPMPWEADKFFAQRGMADHALTLNQWPVGTGPFMLVEQGPNRYVMDRNPNYRGEPYPCEGMPGDREKGWLDDCGKPTPFIDRVVSTIEKERQPLEAKVIQGYYDVPSLETLSDGFKLLQERRDHTGRWKLLQDHGVQLPSSVEPNSWYMGFNWLDPVVGKGATPEEEVRHRKLRQAISIATDWEEYTNIFFDTYGEAQVAMSPIPPGLFGYRAGCDGINPVTHVCKDGRPQRRSIEEAKKLLAEAGYPDGRDAKTGRPLVLYYDSSGVGPAFQARLDWQQKQMAKLNVQLEIRAADYNRFQDRMRKGQEQIFFWGWNADFPDPENFLFLLNSTQSKVKYDGENAANYDNPEYDRLYDEMKNLPDGPQRQEVIDKMVKILQNDAVWMFGIFPGATGVYQTWVHNAKPSLILKDQARYLRIDVPLRVAKIAEWNKARPWPVAVFFALAALVIWPAWRLWQRRERTTARGRLVGADAA